jgi:hypothetical protein
LNNALEFLIAFQYHCFSAPLNLEFENMCWWTGIDDSKNFYWDGKHDPSNHTCACAETGDCILENLTCNCDSSAPEWLLDAGNLTNMSSIPTKELRFGGLKFDGQRAQFELGALSCSGRKVYYAALIDM